MTTNNSSIVKRGEWEVGIKIYGSEPDDEIPAEWYADIDAKYLKVWFHVHDYMIAPETDFQEEALLNSAAGALHVDLREMTDFYITNCLEEDDGEGLLVLANFFDSYSKKLKARNTELSDEIEKRRVDHENFLASLK
ncbi:hypothetical protein VBR58_000819 [Citrobacter freundii]|nr:hypothetical protein [Citrobacter freundii]ELJ9990423.1 hypothetical protein [Citrobacter freundii]EMC0438034.1 hypothetical protein [Citrobacter freundii]EMD0452292.1 hypothetical protein [Citrobacter freundii]